MSRRVRTEINLPTAGLAVACVSILSLALGYGREILIAHQFGASRVTDAFFVAYFTPQIIFQLLVTGPLVWALTPLFAQVGSREGDDTRDRLGGSTLTITVLTLLPLVVLWMFFAHEFAGVMAPSYDGRAREMTADLARIMAPQLLTYGAGAVLTAVLYSRGRVLLPIVAQLVNNALLLVLISFLKPSFGIEGVAIAVVLASFAFLVTIVIGVAATGRTVWPRAPRLGSHGRRLATGITPLIAISALSQVPGFAERAFASSLPGGQLAGISYGYRLLQLALAGIGAMTTVTFVSLAANATRDDRERFGRRIAQNLHLNLKFGILAMGATAVLASRLVHLAYSGGQISPGDEKLIAATTALAAVGLPLVAFIGALQQPLFARSRWRPLAALTVFYVAINVPASAILIAVDGYRGFVFANLLALLAAATGYALYSWKRYELRLRDLVRSIGKTCLATAAASGVLLVLNEFVIGRGVGRTDATLALILGLATYGVVALGTLVAARDAVALGLIEFVRRRAEAMVLPSLRSKVSS